MRFSNREFSTNGTGKNHQELQWQHPQLQGSCPVLSTGALTSFKLLQTLQAEMVKDPVQLEFGNDVREAIYVLCTRGGTDYFAVIRNQHELDAYWKLTRTLPHPSDPSNTLRHISFRTGPSADLLREKVKPVQETL